MMRWFFRIILVELDMIRDEIQELRRYIVRDRIDQHRLDALAKRLGVDAKTMQEAIDDTKET